MKTRLLVILSVNMLLAAPYAYAQEEITAASSEILALTPDLKAGEKIIKRSCRACHGAKLQGAGSYPAVAGHDLEFIIMKLEQYRAGEKFGPNTPLMIPAAKKLSNQDIADIAHFVVTDLN